MVGTQSISTHALTEGDKEQLNLKKTLQKISTHALTEGDIVLGHICGVFP